MARHSRLPWDGTVLGVSALSGAAALAHQLLWTRRLGDLVGATPAATSQVLGAFFLGLSLGAALAVRIAPHVRRPWRALAVTEFGVAVLAIPLLVAPWWAPWCWRAVGPIGAGGLGSLALACGLVTPAAVLMGVTVPLLGRAVLVGPGRLGRDGGRIYAANTAGGVAGVVAVTVLALAGAGAWAMLATAIAANLLVAVLAARRDRADAAPLDAPVPAPEHRPPIAPIVVAFGSGVGVLAAETLAVHLCEQVVPLAFLGTATVLLAVILPLSVAAAGGAWVASRTVRVEPALALVLLLSWAAALATPPVFAWQTDGVRYLTLEFSASVPAFAARVAVLGLVAFGPFMLVAGLVLPLTFAWLEVAGRDPHGRRWGVLLAANGVGGVVGVEVANRVLMPAGGMHLGFAAIAALYASAALAMLVASTGRAWWRTVGAAAALAGVTALVVPRLRALPLVRVDAWPGARGETVHLVDLATGPEGTVAVVDFGDDRVILLNNQYTLGGTGALIRQQRMALLPLVLHPGPRRVALIGLGTGITAGAALLDPGVEDVTAYEISPLVAAMSRRHFGDRTEGLAGDARAHVVVADGRVALGGSTGGWDLIVGDLFMPWQVGTGRLYSVEHFRAVRDALSAGGEFCQWLPAYQLTPEQFRVIVASFREAFPAAYLFRDDLSPETPAFALVGYRDAPLDWDVVARRTAAMRASGRTRDGFVAFPALLRSLYLGVADGALPVALPRNTLDDGWIERRAGLDQIGREWRYLDVETAATLPQYLQDFATGAP